ncbi:MAG: hypothetical protein JGK29_30210 [Microcoleus sp. PH2017_17_BER_D_A]|jgi:hypothetical protein|nr:hypothetical protein [Microcoleus sp. PH2017_17_BER_D_A]
MSLRALSVSVSDPKESNRNGYDIIPMLPEVILNVKCGILEKTPISASMIV